MTVSLRPLERRDFRDLAQWLGAAHVGSFWRDRDVSLEHLEAKYGPRIDGVSAIRVFVVEVGGRGAGVAQVCPASSYAWWPTELGLADFLVLDGFLGEESLLGRGYASEALELLVEMLLRPEGAAAGLCACTRSDNLRSRRLLEGGGFAKVFEGGLDHDELLDMVVYARQR